MARKIDGPIPDDVDRILYVEIESENVKSYRGYKADYLSQNLTEMERNFVFCPKCYGIIRDACSIQDGNVCLECCENEENPKPANRLRNSISTLVIKCPLLRDCGWTGILLDGEKHLKECGRAFVNCPLKCGTVIKRCDNEKHIMGILGYCPLREVICKFCGIIIHFKDLPFHMGVCSNRPIVCKCGKELCFYQLKEHIETECPLASIECPYAKYSCKIGVILRKDLFAHKREFFIEHQDMIEEENCRLKEGQYQLENQHHKLEEKYTLLDGQHTQLLEAKVNLEKRYNHLKHECYQMKQTLRLKRHLYGIVVNVIPKQSQTKKQELHIGCYRFNCIVSVLDSISISLMRLSSSFGNDKNIICITCCVVCLERTESVKEPFSTNKQLSSRAAIGESIDILELQRHCFSRYIQPDGTLNMGVYFDYDFVSYKGIF